MEARVSSDLLTHVQYTIIASHDTVWSYNYIYKLVAWLFIQVGISMKTEVYKGWPLSDKQYGSTV